MLDFKIEDYRIPKYNYIGEFHQGLARVANVKDLYGYIDKKGKEVIPCQFLDAKDFHEDLALVKTKRGWGYINTSGKLVIEDTFYEASNFHDGLAAVTNNGDKWGYINKEGKFEIQAFFKSAYDFSESYGTVISIDNRYHYIDKQGNLSRGYRFCSTFKNGFSIALSETSYLLVRSTQEIVAHISERNVSIIGEPSERICLVSNGKYGYLDENLNVKIPIIYSSGRSFKNGVAIVSVGTDTIGFISSEGVMTAFVKDKQYSNICDFSEGLACVENSVGKHGYIDKKGKEVIPCQFFDADDFSEGLAGVVEAENKLSYINKKGVKKIKFLPVYGARIIYGGNAIQLEADTKEELRTKIVERLEVLKKSLQQEIDNDVEKAKEYILKRE